MRNTEQHDQYAKGAGSGAAIGGGLEKIKRPSQGLKTGKKSLCFSLTRGLFVLKLRPFT
jgi:hypothetical protein